MQHIALETGTAVGTFTITVSWNGHTRKTAALPFDAAASTIQAALNTALDSLGSVSVSVSRTGSPGSADVTITFEGDLSGKNLDPVTVNTSAVTPTAEGFFTITYAGQTTRPINLVNGTSAQASLIQLELRRLSSIGSENVEVTWDSTSTVQQPRFRIALKGTLASTIASTFTVDGSGLANASMKTSALVTGKSAIAETQRIVINTGAETGTFRLAVPVGSTVYQTQALSFTAAASVIQTALNTALDSVGGTTAVTAVTSNGQLTIDVTFGGNLVGADLAATRVLAQADAPAPSGVFTLSYQGQTTGDINFSTDTTVQASNIQSALRGLSGLSADSVSVAWDNASAQGTDRYLVMFSGEQARSNVPQITADFPSFSYATIETGTKVPGIASLGETQRVRILTSGNSSSFTLSVPISGTTFTTAAISTLAGKDEVQTALDNAIASATGATVTVTYWSGTELQVRFGGNLVGADIAEIMGTATSDVTPAQLTQTVAGFDRPEVSPTSKTLVVDYKTHAVQVTTGPETFIRLTHDGARGELTEVSGKMRMALLSDTVVLDGTVAIRMFTQQIQLRSAQNEYTELNSNALEVGVYGAVTVHANGQTAKLDGVTVGLAYYTPQTRAVGETRSWLGLKTSGGKVGTGSNVGTIGASDVVVSLNKGYGFLNSAPNTTVVDFRKTFESADGLHDGVLDIDTGGLDSVLNQPITIRIDFDRELVSMSAEVELVVADFFHTRGTFTYTTTSDTVWLGPSSPPIPVSVKVLSVTNASVFVGSNYHLPNDTSVNPDRQGFDLTGVDFLYVTMTETGGNPRVWTALRASAARGAIVGFSDFSIAAGNLAVHLNTPAADRSVIYSTGAQYGSGPLQINYGQELRELTGTATLDIAGALQVKGGFAFSQSPASKTITVSKNTTHTAKSVRVTTFGFHSVSAFFGAGPYFQDSNRDGTIDDSDTVNDDASGLLLSNGSLAVACFTPLSVADSARYYAVQASLSKISLPGLINLSTDTSFALDASGYRVELNRGNTAADGGAVNFARSYETALNARDGALQVATSPSSSVTFSYTSALERVAIEHALLRISDYVYASGGFAVTRQQMSVTLNDSLHTTVAVNAMIFGAGNVNLFAGSGPYFQNTNGDRFIDNFDTPNADAVGLAIENANVALMLMSRVTGGGTGPKYKALKATASRIGLVGLENVTLSAADLKIEYNDVANTAAANDTTVVDFTRMDGGSYKADTGAGFLTFDYSQSRLLVQVGHAELSVASNVFIHGGLAFSKAAPQTVRLSNGTLKEVSGFDLGASDVAMFAGSNGPYWLNPTGTQLNANAVGVSLQSTTVALSVLRPTASTDKTRYIGLSASSSAFEFVGFDAFALTATAIAVNLNIASGGGATSASPVIDFDATFPPQWTQNIVFDANKDGIVTVEDLRLRSGQAEFASGSHVLYTSQTSSTTPVTYAQLLAALDTGDGTSAAPDGLLQLDEIRAFLRSVDDPLAGKADADADGVLEFGYGISTGSGSEFLRESRRR
ncbi:MAG: hypothetical protein ACKOEO_05300, partial [Planctomycetaceae bacterium]